MNKFSRKKKKTHLWAKCHSGHGRWPWQWAERCTGWCFRSPGRGPRWGWPPEAVGEGARSNTGVRHAPPLWDGTATGAGFGRWFEPVWGNLQRNFVVFGKQMKKMAMKLTGKNGFQRMLSEKTPFRRRRPMGPLLDAAQNLGQTVLWLTHTAGNWLFVGHFWKLGRICRRRRIFEKKRMIYS